MGRRSVCDAFDATAIVERIATGEITATDAYRHYAASATRPCAHATFAGALSRARASAGLPMAVKRGGNLKRGVSGPEIRKRAGAPDRSRAQAGPVLVIGPDAALRVRSGALDVEHGSGKDRVHVRIDVDDAIEPLRPLIDARVFKFIAQREFVRSDFPQAGRNAHRIDRAIIAELLRVSLLPWERHEDAARWMERTIADAVKQHLRD